ncbi:phosphotransferase family protein [Nocardioides pelophilus]|uniref:phosphotransferase family protein n=1 Tax=Nocardioides pelophilus TaxID=2172019 RepID=UPI0028B14522|nr:phosphotransferase family protein [Nocardioides pelophilus]
MTGSLRAVELWMDGQGLGRGPIEAVSPISGGTQNVMLRFERDGRPYVLRRGPEHLRPRSNDVIRRECRVLRSLAGTGVAHPALIAACDDEAVLGGAVFYLMEPVDGFNASIGLPPAHAADASIRHEMGLRLVDALTALAGVDHEAVGLDDFGKPEGFLERQVPRWLAELASYDDFPAYPGPDIGPVDEVAAWLEENRPSSWRPGILHGDFHAANVIFSPDGPDVVAVVDWEMCTIGDPLLDLGWLLATWDLPGAPDEFAGALTRAGGLATGDELAQRYAERSTRDLSALDWYVVLACFKLGIVLEGSHARALSGLAPTEVGDRLHTTAQRLFDRAHALVQQN